MWISQTEDLCQECVNENVQLQRNTIIPALTNRFPASWILCCKDLNPVLTSLFLRSTPTFDPYAMTEHEKSIFGGCVFI